MGVRVGVIIIITKTGSGINGIEVAGLEVYND
jgi:hypothetical protein